MTTTLRPSTKAHQIPPGSRRDTPDARSSRGQNQHEKRRGEAAQIDAVIALAMAAERASTPAPPPAKLLGWI